VLDGGELRIEDEARLRDAVDGDDVAGHDGMRCGGGAFYLLASIGTEGYKDPSSEVYFLEVGDAPIELGVVAFAKERRTS
jgi:hypothetical protein